MADRQNFQQNVIWEGIYENFEEIPSNGNAFNSTIWTAKSIKILENTYDNAEAIGNENFILLDVLELPEFNKKEAIKVLDFGGGVGITYAKLLNKQKNRNLLYHIIENVEVCKSGTAFFKDREKSIYFHSALPDIKDVDIVYIESSLQYVNDWKQLLQKLCKYNPTYLLFVDIPAGEISSFATIQHFYNYQIPYWFFNISDITSTMKEYGFELIGQSSFKAEILGKEQPLPLYNFPAQYRINNSCNLIYKGPQR